jgi:hypothetical protein
MYTAAVLDSESVDLLTTLMRNTLDLEKLGFELQTPQREPLPHHMTINLGRFDHRLNHPDILDERADIYIDSLWWSEEIGVCAARVTEALSHDSFNQPISTINSKTSPHITICLKPPAKPVDSNKLFRNGQGRPEMKSVQLDKTYKLNAVVQVAGMP